ncbi:alpha-tocopherol transfer protein isoform X2 [Haematobia irritans]|uniref:alpha-tocopherol transfer protein isoform X2 n=1 Tax=Haematobia irritans TaxID=7368 RepID=UPI003F50D372
MSADMEKKVDELQQWLKTQPQLPPKIDKGLLRRFLAAMDGDLEDAKKLMLRNFKLRNKHDNIFLKRDPMDSASQEILKVGDYLVLPETTPENYRVILLRLQDVNPEKFKFTDAVKVLFMIMDCRFAITDEIEDGEIVVFDMTGYTLKHLARTSLSSLRVFMKFAQEAHTGRVKQIHVINAASYLDKVLSVVKPFMSRELMQVLHTHLPNSDTPYKFIPRDLLPDEYGGKVGKMSDIRQHWMTKLKEMREYLMDDSRWKMNNADIVDNLQNLEID